jgi:hypothetical protein
MRPTYEEFLQKTLAAIEALPPTEDVLGSVLKDARLAKKGLWCEFGVYHGETLAKIVSARDIAKATGGTAEIWGFDSFRGLPEEWRNGGTIKEPTGKNFPAGSYSVGHVPLPPDGVRFAVGLFSETLPRLQFDVNVTLAHIDCDLYSSTVDVLRFLEMHATSGTFFVFDEIHNYIGFEDGEMKALYEWLYVEGMPQVPVEWVYRSVNQQAALRLL